MIHVQFGSQMFTPRAQPLAGAVVVLAACATPAFAQWTDAPGLNTPIAAQNGLQDQPKIAVTTDGGAYVSWYTGNGFDVYLQRVDAQGDALWDDAGVLIADRSFSSTQDYDLTVDANDNALLTFRDDRFANVQITATKVDGEGEQTWGETGVQLTDTSAFVAAPRIAATSDNAIVVAWTHDSSTRVQRLNPADGSKVWKDDVVLTGSANFSASDLNASTSGSAIVSMVAGFGGQLVAQKLNANGDLLWDAPAVNVFVNGGLQFGNFPTFVADGDGGAVFAWYTNGPLQCWVQRIDADGNVLFGTDGVATSTDNTQLRVSPAVSFKPDTEEIFVFWTELNTLQSQFGLYGQKFDAAGTRQWSETGKEYSALGETEITQVRNVQLGEGAIAFHVETLGFDNQHMFAQRVDSNGDLVWNNITTVANASSGKSRLTVAQNNLDQALLTWKDTRNDDGDIYAQNVNPDGTLGLPNVPGDIDGDGTVGVSDLLILLGEWGPCDDPDNCPADLDNNNSVGVNDLLTLLSNWG